MNKNVLTQTETLIAMRNTAPQDIAAVEAWVKYHSIGTELLASLAGLNDGEAWVWSPHFLKLKEPQRVQIRRRATFDSGATPKNVKAGSKRKVATLTDIDLGAISTRMQATIERQLAEDPAELRRQLANVRKDRDAIGRHYDELRKEYEASQRKVAGKAGIPRADVRRVEQLADRASRVLTQLHDVVALLTPAIGKLSVMVVPAEQTSAHEVIHHRDGDIRNNAVDNLVRVREAKPRIHPADRDWNPGGPRSASARALHNTELAFGRLTPSPLAAQERKGGGPPLPEGLQRKHTVILDAIAWLNHTTDIHEPDRRQVALVAERSAASSTWETDLATLQKAGLLTYPGPSKLALTAAGRKLAQVPAQAPTLQDLHAALYARLPRGQAALLKVLIDGYPDAYTRDGAGSRADPPQSAKSSTFETNCSALKALGLIDYPAQGSLRAADVLFLGGQA